MLRNRAFICLQVTGVPFQRMVPSGLISMVIAGPAPAIVIVEPPRRSRSDGFAGFANADPQTTLSVITHRTALTRANMRSVSPTSDGNLPLFPHPCLEAAPDLPLFRLARILLRRLRGIQPTQGRR